MLINYLPEFLQNIKEYKEIMKSEDNEVTQLKNMIDNSKKEVTIEEATEKGISRFEKILNITNTGNLNLEERRFIIKNKFLNRAPFTHRWLDNKLKNLCGIGNYNIIIDYKNLTLNVEIRVFI